MTVYREIYDIVGDGTFGMKLIKKVGSGTLPEMLKGMYSKFENAAHDIDTYLTMKEEQNNRPPIIKKVKLYPREGLAEDDTES